MALNATRTKPPPLPSGQGQPTLPRSEHSVVWLHTIGHLSRTSLTLSDRCKLTQKNASFIWTNVLNVDTSDCALGAVLQQEQDEALHVIAYATCALSETERRYCITRRELLGVVYALRKYSQHLLGRSIQTDHARRTTCS